MKALKFWQVDAFTKNAFAGNPAAVVIFEDKGIVEDSDFLDSAVGALPAEPQCMSILEDSRTKATPR